MAEAILADLPFRAGDRVIAMLNGMGGTPLLELYLVYGELEQILRGRQITVARRLVGNYITSLDMAGCSITLLQADDELLSPVGRPGADAGPAVGDLNMAVSTAGRAALAGRVAAGFRREPADADRPGFSRRRRRLWSQHGPRLHCGAGGAVRSPSGRISAPPFRACRLSSSAPWAAPAGPLSARFSSAPERPAAGKSELAPADVVALFQAGVEGIQQRGKAELGDKTMLDAMSPALDALDAKISEGSSPGEAAVAAFAAAEDGREATKPLIARKGRASYLGERSIGYLDPGAASTALLFQALNEALAEGTP